MSQILYRLKGNLYPVGSEFHNYSCIDLEVGQKTNCALVLSDPRYIVTSTILTKQMYLLEYFQVFVPDQHLYSEPFREYSYISWDMEHFLLVTMSGKQNNTVPIIMEQSQHSCISCFHKSRIQAPRTKLNVPKFTHSQSLRTS